MGEKKRVSAALFYCSLLALQFGLQPLLGNRYISSDASRISIVVGTEIAKIFIALTSLFLETERSRSNIFSKWSIISSLKYAALPATLYAIQNLFIQYGYANLDSMTYNLLSQTKTLSAAFWLWVILGQKQSTIQIFSLFLLLVAAVMLNLNGTSRSLNSSKMDYNFGLFCCAMASSLSGLSGALVQRALVGSSAQNPLVYTAELAIYGIAFLLVSALFSTRERELILGGNLFHDWNPLTLIPVTTNAFGGLIVGMVTKHAGGVVKGFALIAGIVLTGLCQWAIDGKRLAPKDFAAVAFVSFAIFLHSSYPVTKSKFQTQDGKTTAEKTITKED